MSISPFEQIKETLRGLLPVEILERIPDKWEKVGDILTLRFPEGVPKKYYSIIGEKYSEILGCKTVLNDISGIFGEFRIPNVEIVFGPSETETVHKENGIRFKLDPQKVMFSSGNMDERIRMGKISNPDETVVDLFAGIGYFALPIAVHSNPKKIYACEKNPVAYRFLCENIVLNYVSKIVEPLLGDNQKVAPRNVADRVVMGYIGDTSRFLPVAFECLKDQMGFIHYHDKFPDDVVPDRPMEIVKGIADGYNRSVNLNIYKNVKSYAPGISHYVFDIRVDEK